MKILFLVNDAHELVETQTTSMLIEEAKRRLLSVEVWGLEQALARWQKLPQFDKILIRTNPGRDLARTGMHRNLLTRLSGEELSGKVVNNPTAIAEMMTKDYLLQLPDDLVPQSQLIAKQKELLQFWKIHRDIVVKPRVGTRGAGIVRIQSEQDLHAIGLEDGVIAQPFLPAALEGDARVLIVRGRRLEIDGKTAAILRVPAEGSFLGNLHAGARPEPVQWNPKLDDAVCLTENIVQDWNLDFVGADYCGNKLIELNTFSPGGMYWATKFHDKPFAQKTLDLLL